MLVKEEAGMDTDDREGGLRKRVCRRKKRVVCNSDFVYQRRGGRESSSSKKKGYHAKELLWNSRLVEIELDAAQALADFSRLAHLPSPHCPSDLKWSERRKRTPRSVLKLESQDANVIIKSCLPSSELRMSELESTTSLSHGDKASPLFDCRAESPSSPLPSSKLACRAFLVSGGFASNSSINWVNSVEAMQKCIKTEIKELELGSLVMSSPAKQKPTGFKAQVPLCSVKMELLGPQMDPKIGGLQCLSATESKLRPLANVASELVELRHEMGLVVVNKPKATLTEDDKEARRLRRIQANRESARQTIRKKQILCEELRKQSASMASENDGMKQKRDMLMQELFFLRGQNYHLKAQLELGASGHLVSQESSHLVSLPLWQAPPYGGFPSHVFGWPRMMTQEGNSHYCPDPDNTRESLQKLGSLQFQDTSRIAPGIPASSLDSVGVVEQNSISKSVCSVSPKKLSQEERCTGIVGTETGPCCDADSTIKDSKQSLEREIGLELQTKPELEGAIQASGLISWHTAAAPLIGRNSTLRVQEDMEGYMGLKVSLPVTCGSSCNASLGSMPMNGQGFANLYAWRMTHVPSMAAAEARKRRKELTRKKRLCLKASRLMF